MAADDPLVDLAGAVADGDAIDWAPAQSSAGSLEDAEAIRQLEMIARIAAIHRRAHSGSAGSSASAARAERVRVDPDAPRWGPLVILEKLGAGAFADVYRAWDTSLDREVALKRLRRRSADVSGDTIAREGQLLARVHHANVMAIYGAQVIDGQVGIWGEFLRGRTLAQLVADGGPLSADEALVFADAICRALAAAHRAGLLHRDVKAQNVMREKGGRVVLMDFGLGRELDREGAGFELAGTPLYLAPEMFAGGRASVQSDLYSLGVLLFFLVTGTFPVTGASIEEIRDRHASGQRQRLQDLRPDLPASFVQVVERAIDPDPARRYESAGAMQSAVTTATRGAAVDAPDDRGRRLPALPATVAAVLLALAAAAAGTWFGQRRGAEPASPVMFAIDPPRGAHFSDSLREPGTISPDGESLVFNATDDATGVNRLWLYSLRTMAATPIPQSEASGQAFWSPDSRAVAFFSADGLRRITVGGVRSDAVAAAAEPRGGTWSATGTVLYAEGPRSGLYRISASGEAGKPVPVLMPDRRRGEDGLLWPQFLADGRRFIYFVLSNDDNVRGIYLGSLDGGVRRRLVPSDASGIVTGDHLVFVRDGNVAVQHFDSRTGEVDGSAQVLVRGATATFDYRSAISASQTGVLTYVPIQLSSLDWYDEHGEAHGTIDLPPARYRSPALSPSGRYLAIQQYHDTRSRIVVVDAHSGESVAAISNGRDEKSSVDAQFPTWGPGDRLAYASSDAGWLDLYERGIAPGDKPRTLYRSEADKLPSDWSRDGRFLLFAGLSPGGSYDLSLLSVEAPGTPVPLLSTRADELTGVFSPDGKSLAYVSNESGALAVWVRSFPEATFNVRVSAPGALDPVWTSNDRLAYLDLSGRLIRVAVSNGAVTGPRDVLFTTRVATPGASRNNYAWDPRARLFIINEPAAGTDPRPHVVTNWTRRLESSAHQ
jgi:serine/threonine-protein kinase